MAAPPRVEVVAPGLLVLSRDPGSVQQVMGQGFDGQIQCLRSGPIQSSPNYLQQLRSAHHRMEPEGLWLPAVQALSLGFPRFGGYHQGITSVSE